MEINIQYVSKYKGNFINDELEGFGKKYYQNGDVYEVKTCIKRALGLKANKKDSASLYIILRIDMKYFLLNKGNFS